MNRTHSTLLAAVIAAAGTVGLSQGVTFAQAEGSKQQQAQQKEQTKEEKQAEKAARHALKAEKEELANMPKPAREALLAQIGKGTDVDYYKVVNNGERGFGAHFKDPAGVAMNVLVDQTGKVIVHESAAQTAGANVPAATPAPGAAPSPAAAPAPAPAPAPIAPAASPATTIQPGQGVGLEQIPAAPQAVLREQVKGAHDIRFYRAMLGTQPVWEAKYTTADGKDMAVRVDDAGKIVGSKQIDADEKGRTEVKFDSMPTTVKDHFRDITRGHEGAQFYTNTFKGQPVYETMYWDKDQRWVVRLDSTGKEVDRSVLKDAKHVSDYETKSDKDKDHDNDKDKSKNKK
jgi:hypothetical protein